jgi:tRNA(Arg) A34 adenosine deaminase TadA
MGLKSFVDEESDEEEDEELSSSEDSDEEDEQDEDMVCECECECSVYVEGMYRAGQCLLLYVDARLCVYVSAHNCVVCCGIIVVWLYIDMIYIYIYIYMSHSLFDHTGRSRG